MAHFAHRLLGCCPDVSPFRSADSARAATRWWGFVAASACPGPSMSNIQEKFVSALGCHDRRVRKRLDETPLQRRRHSRASHGASSNGQAEPLGDLAKRNHRTVRGFARCRIDALSLAQARHTPTAEALPRVRSAEAKFAREDTDWLARWGVRSGRTDVSRLSYYGAAGLVPRCRFAGTDDPVSCCSSGAGTCGSRVVGLQASGRWEIRTAGSSCSSRCTRSVFPSTGRTTGYLVPRTPLGAFLAIVVAPSSCRVHCGQTGAV